MPDLTWDEDLAAAAAEYSSKCEFAHPPNNPYGENIYLGWGPAYTDGASEAKKASDKWHTEIDNVDADWDCIANRPEATCGHYSQEVWAETTKVSQTDIMSNVGSKLGQIGSKWDKSGSLKSPRFVPFGANLTQFGANTDIPGV